MNSFLLPILLAPILLATSVQAGQIAVVNGWSRATAAPHGTAVGYLTITNTGPADRLIAASCDGAAHTMLHQSTTGMAAMPGMGAVPTEHMQLMAGIDIPAHGQLVLAPGGFHLMLSGMASRLDPGQSVPCRLYFTQAGALPITLAVRPAGAAAF